MAKQNEDRRRQRARCPFALLLDPTACRSYDLHWMAHGRRRQLGVIHSSFGCRHVDLNSRDDKGLRPLHVAASKGQVDVASRLISDGADVNARDDGGYTPLHFAAERGHVEVVSLLLSMGADVHAGMGNSFAKYLQGYKSGSGVGASALHCAVLKGRTEIAALLISHGADVGARDDSDITPLHYAALQGQTEVAALLIAKGADVNALTSGNVTPLELAEKDTEVYSLLQASGALRRSWWKRSCNGWLRFFQKVPTRITNGMYFVGKRTVIGRCLDTYDEERIYAFAMSPACPAGERGTVLIKNVELGISREVFLLLARKIVLSQSLPGEDAEGILRRIEDEIAKPPPD